MKDSQPMSVDISSQNEMALSALPPVSLKDANNIYRADSVDPDESFHLNLSDDESGEKKADVCETSQESEDEILNKFVTHESDDRTIPNGCAEPDEKLEDRLLNDCVDNKDEECVNNTETSEDRDLNNKKSVFSESAPDLDERKDDDAETKDGETKTTDDHDDSNKMAADTKTHEQQIETEKPPSPADEDEKREQVEDVEMKEESEAKQNEEAAEMKENEEAAEMKEKEEAAEMKEKANAELLKDQILDTEHLLQIVDQQDTVDEPNENSCSGENTPDKDESDEAETDKNDDEEEASTTKNDDDTVDIEEGSPYKGDFDNSELDKEYEKIVNEKENEENAEKEVAVEAEKMDAEEGEKATDAPEEKSVEEDEKDTELSMEATEKTEEQTSEPTEETSEETKSNNEMETETQTENSDAVDAALKTKRSLSEPDAIVEPKRIRLEDDDAANEDEKPIEEEKIEEVEKPIPTTVTELTTISEYMKKNSLKRLTREDLEQICLMKMCEAICHKSEIGELRHQLSIQEQMVEMWRKEAAALVKQARDLEIVNKRLLHEVRLKTDKEKPLVPVRITRSVGLQVRSDNNVTYNTMQPKRRFGRPTTTTTVSTPPPKMAPGRPSSSKTTTPIKAVISKSVPASPNNKQTSVSKPKQIIPKTPNSLLSKALQNSTAQAAANSSPNATTVGSNVAPPLASISSTSTTSTSPATTKSTSNASPKIAKSTETKVGVIDLTDEDEKKPSITPANTTTVNATQGVRIVSAPVKSTNSASSANVVNPPRIMYLYNNQLHQGVITDSPKGGPQKVMFKLNSNVLGQTNGVLTTVTSGTPITVTNGTVRTVQSVRAPTTTTARTSTSSKTSSKHPAPLPPPPIAQIGLAARRPIPPKPHLSIRRSSGGIILSWKMPYLLDNYEAIASYQLYAYQETTSPPSSDMWRKVGDVKALALPMACTLTQFADGNKYHFAVRAVDVQKRMGPFSDPEQILL